jgi:IS30 family transposase
LRARAILNGEEQANFASTGKLTWDQWHRRYGHISITTLQQLDREGLVNGLSIDQSSIPSKTCDACNEAKQAHKPFPQEAQNRSKVPGERIVSDVWGPARVISIGGWKYYISFGDDCVRYVIVLFLREKGEAAIRIKERVGKVKQRFGKGPTYLRVDNGTELVNEKVKKFCAQEGITIEQSAPYSPSQNGIAERFNRTLIELVRAMLIEKGLPTFLWDEAVSHATYIRNRSPTKALKGKTPYEAWTGKKPDVSHFREFGCDVWVLDKDKNRSKLAPKSKKMVFVGFVEGSKAVRYWDKKMRNIKISRNVAFNENEEPRELEVIEMPGLQSEGEDVNNTPLQTTSNNPDVTQDTPKNANEPTYNEIPPPDEPQTRNLRPRNAKIDYKQLNDPSLRQPSTRSKASSTPTPSPDVSRPTESTKAKTTLKEKAILAIETLVLEEEFTFSAVEEDLPKNYEGAIGGEEGEQWKAAMDEEIGTLGKMGTWEMKDLPQDRKAIGCKWVFAKKRDETGCVIRYKARLVAQGFSQKPGTDYNNDGTFAPVMRFETLCTLLAYAAVNNLKLRQFDVKSAYLHGYLNETIYMNQPPGYNDNSGRVCLLIRSLYGLKQAGNVWNQELN